MLLMVALWHAHMQEFVLNDGCCSKEEQSDFIMDNRKV